MTVIQFYFSRPKNEDTHVTLLYNDESHTFHNVGNIVILNCNFLSSSVSYNFIINY